MTLASSPMNIPDLYQVTLASIGDAVIATDIEGRVTFLNHVAEKLTRWTIADARGRPLPEVFNIVIESSRKPVENPAMRALRENSVVALANHTILIAKDGTDVPIDDSASPIRDEAGKVSGAVLVFRDITERKKAERAQATLAAIVASSDDAIVSKTLDGIIASWNAGAERVFGYTAEAAVGRSITLIIPPERLHEEADIIGRIRRGERIDHFETVRVARDGRLVDISLTVSPVRDPEGNIVGASKVARDITDRRRTEQALREADCRKDEFLATLAHELRNPLAPIRTGVQVLKANPGTAEAAETLAMMERQAGHLTRLVDDLMDVARVTSGKIMLRTERLDLRTAARGAAEASRPVVEGNRHALDLRLPGESLVVEGDPVRLVQVLTNLLTNAAKYTEPGGRIELLATREGGDAVVRVSDSGVGIPAEMLPKVFEMFAQVGTSLDRSQGGLGIGLTLVRKLVEMHGGSASVESEGANKGSTFTVRLPLAASDVGQSSVSEPRVNGKSTHATPLKVLVVDDNKDGATSLAMLLKLSGHVSRSAHSGPEGIDVATEFHPDVIFLDIGLPGMSGHEVARTLRQNPAFAATTVVALTGWGSDEDRRKSKESGFDEHITKPIDSDDVRRILAGVRK